MKHCGMDVHSKSTTVEMLDTATGEVTRRVVRTEREALGKWLSREAQMRVVLEASTVSHWVAEVVEQFGHHVVVVDPNRTKAVAVAGGHKKTDRLDAATLAWLSSKDALVPSHRPSRETRERRRRLMLRHRLVRSRGDLVRAVRSALAAEGLGVRGRKARGFAEAVRALLGEDPLLGSLTPVLQAIDMFDARIAEADRQLQAETKEDPVVQRLMTVDGVGPVVATAYRLVIEEASRFRSGREAAAYVGLVPTVHNSGDPKNRLGRISKHGDKVLRSLLVEAAHSLLHRCHRPSDLRAWGLKVAAKVGAKKAAVAVARKLCVVMWAMWKKEKPFNPCILSAPSAPRD